MAKIKVQCAYCNKPLERPPHRVKTYKNQFCNSKCIGKWMSENQQGENNPNWTGGKVEVICTYCGETLERNPWWGKTHKNPFCNKKCYGKWMRENQQGENSPRWVARVEVKCDYCGTIKEVTPSRVSEHNFCNHKCMGKWQRENLVGENSPNWEGYHSKGVPKYDTYASQLEWAESVRRHPEDENVLQVKCIKCHVWFTPTLSEVNSRIYGGLGRSGGNNFYCSEECKGACSIFNQQLYPKGHKPDRSREVQPELRALVLERDDYECQKCGSREEPECHHYEGVEQNPIESADVDMCITLCKSCHKWVHTQEGCTYYDLRKIECKEEITYGVK